MDSPRTDGRGIKIAVCGKGGVGKSTISAALAILLARRGVGVLAVDADPDGSLAAALGIPLEERGDIVPISQRRALIEERTGAKVRDYGQIFKLNPEVSDIARTCALTHDGVSLLVLGAVQRGGGGCACPESVLIRSLVTDLVLFQNDALVMDMEAGVEHLGRATAQGVDEMLVVVEPTMRSVESARHVFRLAAEVGLARVGVVANKIASAEDESFLRHALADAPFLGVIPYDGLITRNDREGRGVVDGLGARTIDAFLSVLGAIQRGRAA